MTASSVLSQKGFRSSACSHHLHKFDLGHSSHRRAANFLRSSQRPVRTLRNTGSVCVPFRFCTYWQIVDREFPRVGVTSVGKKVDLRLESCNRNLMQYACWKRPQVHKDHTELTSIKLLRTTAAEVVGSRLRWTSN